MLFWGLSFIWSARLLNYYEPVTIIFFRLIISSGLLFAIHVFFVKGEYIARKDWGLLLLSALFNPFLYFMGENYGLKYSSPTIAAVIIATIPVFSPLAGYIVARERLSLLNFAGIGISFGGVVVMLLTRDLSLGVDRRGIMFLSLAVLAALCYSATLKKLTSRYHAVTLVAWQNLVGAMMFLPFFLVFEAGNAVKVPLNAEIISSLFFLAILASSVAFVFFAHSIKLLGVSRANIYSNLIPVFTAIFSYFLLGESISGQKVAGILLVIGGVYLSERIKRRD
jgi:drug/metabolite transporter (DMT)-like permease